MSPAFRVILTSALSMAFCLGAAESPFPVLEPKSPKEALETFDLHPDFQISLVASEPLIADPVAVGFEETGNLYVAEMRGYSERRDDKMGEVKYLKDTDGDGVMDEASVFADGLQWPTALHCFDGGIFVLAAPDLFFLKDTNGDGLADTKEVVLTGFCVQSSRLNVQQLPNSMRWGPDNRIHIAEGGNGSRLRRPDQPESEAVSVRRATIALDPFTREIEILNGGGQFGMAFDDEGRRFVTSNSRHIMQVAYDRLPAGTKTTRSAPAPQSLKGIAEDGDAAPVFRRSPDEAWRVLRTRWRVAGTVRGPVEGGGRPSGYFTGATGVCIYRPGLESPYHGQAFISDVGSNLIHRKQISDNGNIFLTADRHPEEKGREFLASSDNWFRPVQIENGPHGGLYLLDMYREVIEHPWSLPPGIKEHIDLNRGNDLGRIWKITPKKHRKILNRIHAANALEVLTENSSAWETDTARRLLVERLHTLNPKGKEKLLRDVEGHLSTPSNPVSTIQLLSILKSFGGLSPAVLLKALNGQTQDEISMSSAWVRLIATAVHGDPPPLFTGTFEDAEKIWKRLAAGSNETRFHLALALGGSPFRPEQNWRLADHLMAQPAKGDLETAFQLMIHNLPDPVPSSIWQRYSQTSFASLLFPKVKASLNQDSIKELLASQKDSAQLIQLASEGASQLKPPVDSGLADRLRLAARSELMHSPLESIRALSLLGSEKQERELFGFLEENGNKVSRSEIVDHLQRNASPILFAKLLKLSTSLTPAVRQRFFSNVLKNKEQSLWLLEHLKESPDLSRHLGAQVKTALRQHKDASISKLAGTLLGHGDQASYDMLYQKYLASLSIKGDGKAGREIFQQRCAACHRAGAEGPELGPNLVTVAAAGRESLLGNIIAPSREVASQYEAWTLSMEDGEEYTGLVLKEAQDNLTLGMVGTTTQFQRDQILAMSPTGRSLMPDGLSEGLSAEDMADLLAFIEGLTNPELK